MWLYQMDKVFLCYDTSIHKVLPILKILINIKPLEDVFLIRTKCDFLDPTKAE